MTAPSNLNIQVRTGVDSNQVRKAGGLYSADYGSDTESISDSQLVTLPPNDSFQSTSGEATVALLFKTTAAVNFTALTQAGRSINMTVNQMLFLDEPLANYTITNGSNATVRVTLSAVTVSSGSPPPPIDSGSITTVDFADFTYGGPSVGSYNRDTTQSNGYLIHLNIGDSIIFPNPATYNDSGVWVVSAIDPSTHNVTFTRRSDFALGSTITSNVLLVVKNTITSTPQLLLLKVLNQSGEVSTGILDGTTYELIAQAATGVQYAYSNDEDDLITLESDEFGNTHIYLDKDAVSSYVRSQINAQDIENALGYVAAKAKVEVPFSYNDASPSFLWSSIADKLITSVELCIVTPFDGVGATLSVGDSVNTEILMAVDANNPAEAASYVSNPNEAYGNNGYVINLFIEPGEGATQGSGLVILTIQQ